MAHLIAERMHDRATGTNSPKADIAAKTIQQRSVAGLLVRADGSTPLKMSIRRLIAAAATRVGMRETSEFPMAN
jgi:hypothetical protein